MRFIFQQSRIFEAGDPIDPNGEQRIVKGKDEQRARAQLPSPGTGRRWVLLSQLVDEERSDG